MTDDVNSLTEDGLPDAFWSVSDKFIGDDVLRMMHAELSARLRNENPHADTLELMAIERIASLYFYLRSRENAGAIRSDQAYKSMLQMWASMAADLRKSREANADVDQVRAEILTSVARAVKDAFAGLDPEFAGVAKRRIAERLDKV